MNVRNGITREAIAKFFPHVSYAHRFLLLPEHGCVYVKNAKAGVSTIGLWMARIHRNDPSFVPAEDTNRARGVPTASQAGWPTTLRMLDGGGFRFSFVRHPLRRFESAYRDKIAGVADNQWRSEIAKRLGLRPGQPVTMEHFVTAVEGQDPLRMDPHWRPQHLNLMHPLVGYDFLGRLETFATDLSQIRELAGLPEMPFEVRNVTARRTDGHPLDHRAELRRRVEAIYAQDFELYGY